MLEIAHNSFDGNFVTQLKINTKMGTLLDGEQDLGLSNA